MHRRMLTTILMIIGLSLAWKAAAAQTMAPGSSLAEAETRPLPPAIAYAARADAIPPHRWVLPRLSKSLYQPSPGALLALENNWWSESSAMIGLNTAPSRRSGSLAGEAASSIIAVTWGHWQRPL